MYIKNLPDLTKPKPSLHMAGVFKERITAFLIFLTLFFFVYADCASYAGVVGLTNSNSGDSSVVVVRCSDKERKALLTFREGLEDPSARLSSWVGEDCCAWEGVLCSRRTGAVVKLDLSNNVNRSLTLGGRLVPSLLQLKQLSYLNLSKNDFNETAVPKFFGSLKKLVYLDLSYSSFSGMVPPYLGNLSNLRYLDLSTLDCWVSDLNWISQLSSLEYINLDHMNLSLANTHWLQAFNMLLSLSELHLQDCQLHNFPHSMPYLNFTSLSIIDLSLNYFNSLVPQYFFNMSRHLVELDLSSCHLKGLLTQVVRGDSCNIKHLHLGGNELRGNISELLGGLSRSNDSLEEFHLPDSRFHGQLPAGNSRKGMCAKIRSLDLRDNAISGPLPESIGMLSNLRFLDLYNNTISGPLPPSIGKLFNLEVLELGLNNMNGTIPENSLQNLTKLTKLGLSKNGWEGILSQNHFLGLTNLKDFQVSSSSLAFRFNISHRWNPPFSLETLSIYNCTLGPTFPSWLQNQTQLTGLRLSRTGIASEVPHWFWNMSRLMMYVDLSSNQLRGTLPASLDFPLGYNDIDLSSNSLEGPLPLWSNVFSLILAGNLFSGSIPLNMGHVMSETIFLDLSGNLITGSIPYSIGKMKYLQYLTLSNNSLSGHIPDKWTDMQDLYALDLSSNNLSGNIPASIFSLSSLLWLRLSRNNLSGELSFLLRNSSSCTSLITLDLGNNKFSGQIPESIGESFLSLSELRMRGNAFTGKIPQQLCRLPMLHVLDLSLNKLSGSIPPCLGNLSGLVTASVEQHMPLYRKLETVVKGTEYEYSFWRLLILNLIDLSDNSLSGEIPKEVTKLKILGTLNMSHNQLTGTIPENIGDLQQLETLDLSCNHVSGAIPQSMISMTFLNHLNLSQNNLSGTIPSEKQFSTFDASVFSGNRGLCGLPLTKCIVPCQEDKGCKRDHDKGNSNEDKYENIGVYISVVLGFMVGFWIVCGSLVIKESWRHAFFRFIGKAKDWLVVIVSVNINRIRRRDRN